MISPNGYYDVPDNYMTQEEEWDGLMDPAWQRQQTKVLEVEQKVKKLVSLSLRQSLLFYTYDQLIVRTATRSTLKMTANLTQILNFKVNFHQEFELFSRKTIYANNS